MKGGLTGSNAALGAYLDVLPFQHVFVQGHDAGLGRIERRSRVAEALLLGNTPKRSSSTMPLMARPLPRHGSLSLSEAHFSGYCGNEGWGLQVCPFDSGGNQGHYSGVEIPLQMRDGGFEPGESRHSGEGNCQSGVGISTMFETLSGCLCGRL